MSFPIFFAKFDTGLLADYSAHGGALTTTLTGTVTQSGGKADFTASGVKRLDFSTFYNVPTGQIQAVKFKLTPNYSGNPAFTQHFLSMGGVGPNNADANRFHIQHDTAGGFYLQSHCEVSNSPVSINFTWNPVAGTEYEVYAYSDWNAGIHKVFIDGVQKVQNTSTTGIKMNSVAWFRIGLYFDTAGTDQANFKMRDFAAFDQVQETANYTPGYTLVVPLVDTDPGVANVKSLIGYNFGGSALVGTYDGSDRWTAPSPGDLRSGVQLKNNSTSLNLTGALIAPSLANTKIGVAGDGGVGTYDGSDRWSVPSTSNVLALVSYRENSTVDNRIGTFVPDFPSQNDVRLGVDFDDGFLTGRLDLPDPMNVKSGVSFDQGSQIGTDKGADFNTSPGTPNVLEGISWMYLGDNKVGTLINSLPNPKTIKLTGQSIENSQAVAINTVEIPGKEPVVRAIGMVKKNITHR